MSVKTYSPNGIVHNTSVDFVRRSVQQPIHLVQYDDTLPIVAVKLYRNGAEYKIDSDTDATIRFGKPDKTFVIKPVLGCDSTRTILYFEITDQMTVLAGEYSPIIELNTNGKIAGSSPIRIIMDRNSVQHSDIESTYEYPALVEYADIAKKSESEALASAERAAISEKNSKESEDNAKISENNALASENKSKTSENNAKISELNASASEEIAKTSANVSKTCLEQTRTIANQQDGILTEINNKLKLTQFSVDDDACLIYTDDTGYKFLVDNDGNLNWEVTNNG